MGNIEGSAVGIKKIGEVLPVLHLLLPAVRECVASDGIVSGPGVFNNRGLMLDNCLIADGLPHHVVCRVHNQTRVDGTFVLATSQNPFKLSTASRAALRFVI